MKTFFSCIWRPMGQTAPVPKRVARNLLAPPFAPAASLPPERMTYTEAGWSSNGTPTKRPQISAGTVLGFVKLPPYLAIRYQPRFRTTIASEQRSSLSECLPEAACWSWRTRKWPAVFGSSVRGRSPGANESSMKKAKQNRYDNLRPEYGFASMKRRVRGKYVRRFREGTNIVLLRPDAAEAFPTEDVLQRSATGDPQYDSGGSTYRWATG